jgi:hypothetical protein
MIIISCSHAVASMNCFPGMQTCLSTSGALNLTKNSVPLVFMQSSPCRLWSIKHLVIFGGGLRLAQLEKLKRHVAKISNFTQNSFSL